MNYFDKGQRVKLIHVAPDLRQNLPLGAKGTAEEPVHGKPEYQWVLFDGRDEAMTMKPEELEAC